MSTMFQNFFKGQQSQQQQQPTQGQGPNTQQSQQQQQQRQGPQGQQGATNDPESMENPIDVYKNLWANPTESQNEQAPQFKVDPKVVEQVSSQFDFSQNLPEHITTKMQNGEQFQSQDYLDLMNHVGRATYAKAIEHLSHLTGTYVDLHSKHSQKGLPGLIKQQLAQSKIGNIPAAQNNPVLREHMGIVAERLAKQYPNASEEWVAEQTQQYFLNMAKQLNPEAFTGKGEDGSGATGRQPQQVNWDEFFQGQPRGQQQ